MDRQHASKSSGWFGEQLKHIESKRREGDIVLLSNRGYLYYRDSQIHQYYWLHMFLQEILIKLSPPVVSEDNVVALE